MALKYPGVAARVSTTGFLPSGLGSSPSPVKKLPVWHSLIGAHVMRPAASTPGIRAARCSKSVQNAIHCSGFGRVPSDSGIVATST